MRNTATVLRALRPYARQHRRWLRGGALATCFVVAARLALPWPLRALTDLWTAPAPAAWPAPWDALFSAPGLGLLFLLLLLVHGCADHLERLYFARFSIGVVRDLRKAVFRAVVQADGPARGVKAGDLVARLTADTERFKTGLKGLLVHGATNGVIFLGVTLVLFGMDVRLGLLVGGAGAGAAALASWGARRNRRHALAHRRQEGRLANRIVRSLRADPPPARFGKLGKASGRVEASITNVQGLTTWGAHALFGLAVLAALWLGTDAVAAGTMAPGEMVLFILYVLILRSPLIRLARQGAQAGNVVGTGMRLVHALENAQPAAPDDGPPTPTAPAPPLATSYP